VVLVIVEHEHEHEQKFSRMSEVQLQLARAHP